MSFIGYVALAGVCSLLCYWVFQSVNKYRLSYSNECRPPRKYPHRDPILGTDLIFRIVQAMKHDIFLPELYQLHMDHGTTFGVTNLGSPSIFTVDSENIRTVFANRCEDWGVGPIRYPAAKEFCGAGLMTTDGSLYKHSKSMVQPSFEKQAISDFTTLDKLLERMLNKIDETALSVDLQPLFNSLFVDANTNFLFGESIGALDGSKESEGVLEAFEAAMSGTGIRIALGPFKYFGKKRKWLQACYRAQCFTDRYANKALEFRKRPEQRKEGKRTVLLHNLAEQSIAKEELRNEIIQAFFVAQNTTSTLLANVMWAMARNPDTWVRLREEVHSALGTARPTYAQVLNMPYMRKVLNESLRLHPVLAKTQRVALRSTRLPRGGGADGEAPIYVAEGTTVHLSPCVIHRLPQIWGNDASEYNVDRWESFKPDPYEFLPFGAGIRQCLGKQKALADAGYVLSRFAQLFSRIESTDDHEWQGRVQLSVYNVHGCKVRLFRA